MEKKRRFLQEHIILDREIYDEIMPAKADDSHYLIIVEIEDKTILGLYVAKVPKPYLRCFINPYCVN
jgi:hypothetical protein